jgi:hypothetical protein
MMICTLTSVTYHAKNNDEMGKGKEKKKLRKNERAIH